MSQITIGSEEISLVKQNNQRRYVKLQVIDRNFHSIGVVQGRLISCNISIDANSNISRTASISMETESDYLQTPYADVSIDLQRDMPGNYYIKIWAGIEDNNTLRVYWYSQGVFIISQSSYSFDPKTRTLNVSLTDLMTDLNGDRGGELHAFTSIVKNKQRIDDVMKNVMELVGINNYSIEPITVLRDVNEPLDNHASETDYMVPYDMEFSVGVTAYEILEKLVGLYPYYEMGFDANGMFFVRKETLEQDDSYAVIDYPTLADLVISEDTTIDWNYVKNHIEVWGKDGKCYGEAEDTTSGSPFQINCIPLRRLVVKDNEYGIDTNTICDRYKDAEEQEKLIKEQATLEEKVARLAKIKNPTTEEQRELNKARGKLSRNRQEQAWNIDISGNELAKQWAERILYDRTRLQDNVTIKTVLMPFLNDVNFKMSYKSQIDKIARNYVVKSINHDLTGGTTTINMIRFYNDQCSNYWDQLGKPVITSAQGVGMDIIVETNNVEHAETYVLYVNYSKVGTYTSTTMIYHVPDGLEGTYYVKVVAEAPYYRSSEASDSATVTVTPLIDGILITDNDEDIITDDGDEIMLDD